MKYAAAILLSFFLVGSLAAAEALSKKQMDAAQHISQLSIPTPAELFAAIDKSRKPDWAAFYREPGPMSYPSRSQTAFNLGTLVADGFMAVEAQDGQQVKNTGKEIISLAKALGVGEDVLVRGKSISDFADKNDWFSLREELEATTNEVRRAMSTQHDDALASLITAGAWIRTLQIAGRAAALGADEKTYQVLRQPDLFLILRDDLQQLPDKVRDGPVIIHASAVISEIAEIMRGTKDNAMLSAEQVASLHNAAGKLINAMGASQP